MKQVIVGNYNAGYEHLQVVLREGDGGEFYCLPELGKIPRIKVGADYDDWSQVVAILLHEIIEFLMLKAGSRFCRDGDMSNDHAGFTFMFTHCQHTDICVKAAEFLVACLPDFVRAWKKWKNEERKSREKKS